MKYLVVILLFVSTLVSADVYQLGEVVEEPSLESQREVCQGVVEDYKTKTRLVDIKLSTCTKVKYTATYYLVVIGTKLNLTSESAVAVDIKYNDYSRRYKVE